MSNRWNKILFLTLFFAAFLGKSFAQKIVKSYAVKKWDFNSDWSDISPVILPKGLVFVSNREDKAVVSRVSATQSEPFFRLFYAEKEGENFKKPIRMEGDVNGSFSEGPLSFASDGRALFFSRNLPIKKGIKSSYKARFGIFSANFQNGKISNVRAFPFNHPEYSVTHPALSKNGNYLIFASNLPGGFGGSDLYVSYNKNGEWEKPVNLGREINTVQDEVFPHVNAEGTLFFASNGHRGLGGLDIYKANYQNFEWKEVENLGSTFNTPADDFGYVESSDKSMGFLCSNRDKKTKDDLYQFRVSKTTFEDCDSLKQMDFCRTFYEESSMDVDSLPLVYEWDFGSGVKIKGNVVNHCFEKPGKYKVHLNIIDLITNQLYMNEASYEIDIEPITGPYFYLPDTVAMGTILEFNASKSQKKDAVAQNYYWDFGDGTLEQGPLAVHSFKTVGDFPLRLGVAFKGENGVFSECVIKNIKVVDLSKIQQKKRLAHKPYFSIRDKSGNVYKIQLVTSKQRLSLNAFYFKQIGKVEEYYDRGIFGYTIGNFQKPEQCYPELKRVREKGFKEAVVIAMRENKVVSGTDESFFVKLPNNFNFIRIVAIYGKVMNSEGFPVRATIKLEDMQTGTLLDEFVSDSLTGKYKLELPVDKAYSYYIQKEGFFPFSNFIDLTKENDLSEVRSDIYLMSTTKMLKDTLGVRVNNLFFNAENNELRPESEFEVKRLAKYFKSLPNLFFEIESHSDNLGDKYSKVISCQKRADEVKKKLASLGCDPEKISAISFGESKPLTLNPKLQHINNRIEVKIKLGR